MQISINRKGLVLISGLDFLLTSCPVLPVSLCHDSAKRGEAGIWQAFYHATFWEYLDRNLAIEVSCRGLA